MRAMLNDNKEIIHIIPNESPLMEIIRRSAQEGVRGKAPEWLDDELHPVDFGPYRIIAHNIVDDVHHLMIRDMVNGVDIYLSEDRDERVQHNHTCL